ncbi:MAG TPA: hypothetical protein DC054_21735 [Blastocatellia bacterium]|nr:hypothetical protein [Blastocatellia bacterium]
MVDEQGGEFVSDGGEQGGEFVSLATAVTARTMVKEIAKNRFFMVVMVFSFDLPKWSSIDCAMRGVSPLATLRMRSALHLIPVQNLRGKVFITIQER